MKKQRRRKPLRFLREQPPNREATHQTIRKHRRDEVLFLLGKGYLEKHHVEAADQIEKIWSALSRAAVRLGMTYERRDYDTPKKYHGKTPFDLMTAHEQHIYQHFYKPWAKIVGVRIPSRSSTTWLQLVLDVVVDNYGVATLERAYGLSRGHKVASKYLREGLEHYAKIAGILPPKQHIVGGSLSVPKKVNRC